LEEALVTKLQSQQPDWRESVTDQLVSDFQRDGVVLLPQAIHPAWIDLIDLGIQRVLAGSSPYKFRFYEGTEGEFLDATRNFDVNPEFQRLLYDSPIADILGRYMQSDNVWLLFDHVFAKEGGCCNRTPWHQDVPYWPVAGNQLASMWISLDPLPKSECLEFIRGSHRGTLYDGFDPGSSNPTDPHYGEGFPPLPDIEAERDKWDIVSWDITPGDVIVFHPASLHGGGATTAGRRRRALSVRCYGDDVVYDKRPPTKRTAPATPGLELQLQPGEPLRHPLYPKLRPTPPHQRPGYYE
jgi:ectoine hydroxylase-related dioxygenase (phytanoyl-CoA dioxygenase family)